MKKFKEFLEESQLNEVAIQFGRQAYPKFNTIVILAGGAGSGKGFVLDNLLSINGRVFDVDEMKRLAMASTLFAAKVKKEMGVDISDMNLRKSENVAQLHDIIGNIYQLDKKLMSVNVKNVLRAPADRKPNLIFDVTLKDLNKLNKLTELSQKMGYKKEDIHLVWVMNAFDVAVEQNASRSRVVPEEIMLTTHEGAALTMAKIATMGTKLKKYLDGDIFIAFNKATLKDKAGTVIRQGDSDIAKSKSGGFYVKKANYVHMKEKGKTQKSMKDLGMDIVNKIKSYVPNTITWGK
jgi:predicted kinase